MKLRLLLATASAAAVTALNAHAVTYGNYELEALTGTGTNTSVCVFDFGTAQYAFGYAYDGTGETGSDMLAALTNANIGVTVAMTNYGTADSPNFFVDNISYTVGGSTYALITSASYADDPYLYPNYWLGNGGGTGPTSWASPNSYGISGRTLADGSWDGFTQAKYWLNGTFEASAPFGAFAAVPEPAALGLLALGGLALLRRRR